MIWEDVTTQCFASIEEHGLEALVVLGGDGTMACAQPFAAAGIPVIGVPKTIDNDVIGTELTFGFQSAVDFFVCVWGFRHTSWANEKVNIGQCCHIDGINIRESDDFQPFCSQPDCRGNLYRLR